MNNCKGYTLLETIVALSLFLAVVVPLMERMSVVIRINKGKQKMVAACIIEQEAAILHSFPDQIFTTKQRQINEKAWIVKASFKGEILKTCHISVYRKNKMIDRAIFYLYKK